MDPAVCYQIARKNYLYGKWIQGCGWYPDRVARIYNRNYSEFGLSQVHESLVGKSYQKLKGHLLHTPFHGPEDFLRKMEHYSSLFAKQYQGKRKSSYAKAALHSGFAFVKSYILKKGFLDGSHGLIISVYNAKTAFIKYLKLKRLNKNPVNEEYFPS